MSMLACDAAVAFALLLAAPSAGPAARLTLRGVESPASAPPLAGASYLRRTGVEMVRTGGDSLDNGRTWTTWKPSPDFDTGLPHGYRRDPLPLFVDPVNGRLLSVLNAMDTPGLDPTINEPPVALETYYLRYRVSVDGGRTFLFDEPIVQHGRTPGHPFDGVTRGRNAIFLGDVGSRPIRTRRGDIIVPAQACRLGPDGKLANPGGGWTWTDVVLLIGRWRKDSPGESLPRYRGAGGQCRIDWRASVRIVGDPARSTRGMIEPTLAEMPDGRLLCVMRGSNGGSKDPECKLPSYRWFSVSKDGGFHWSKPEPWRYDDGAAFFSPSSMSLLLRTSAGRVFWIGNINETNCRGNDPRWPLVIGEVDPKTLSLIRSSVVTLDTKRPDEPGVNLSHFWAFEDRETHDIVVAGARYSEGYKTSSPVVYRVAVGQ